MRTTLKTMVCALILVSACAQSEPSGSGLRHQSNDGGLNGDGANASLDDLNALVPSLGFPSGIPDSTEDHVGPTGVLIPGRCPPSQEEVNRQVALKNPQIPGGTDLESRIQRYEMAISAVQDFDCPISSTTLLERLNSLTALRADPNKDAIVQGLGFNETPADQHEEEPVETPVDAGSLVPSLGFPAGDPASTQDHIGPVGVPIPGRCPPSQEEVNRQVALKNPQFPSGIDLESRIQRFELTISAVQDFNCPVSSTTLLGRLKSLTALRGDPNAASILEGLGFNETPADRQ